MKTTDLPRTKDDPELLVEPDEEPDVLGSALAAAPASDATPYASTASDTRVELKHDPYRIRGDALRRSLYFTMLAWIPGAFWAGAISGAPTIKLAKYLGANDFILALILTVVPLASVLLQIPGSMVVEWLGSRKKFFIWTCTPHRALYMVVGLLPWITPEGAKWPALAMAGLLMLSLSLNNFGGQAWTNWMADLVPPRVRGLYFSRRSRMGIAVICLSGLAVALLLDLSEQAWFDASMRRLGDWVKMPPLIFLISIIFVVAGFVGMFDILSFLKVEEPPMKAVPSEPLFQRLARPLHDSHFCRFVVYWSVWNAAQGVCGWMWWPYLLGFFEAQKKAGNHAWWTDHMYLAATVILGVGFQLGQFIGYPMWGRAVDRFGRKPVLFVSSTLHSVGWVWWIFLSPALAPWLFVTQMVSGFLYGGQDIGSFNMMLQFNRRGGPGYQALGSVIFSIVGAGAAAASGVLADHYLKHFAWTIGAGTPYEHTFNKYAVIVAAAIAIKYIADLVFLPWVQDVGDKPASHALRFVFDNTYGYLNTLIFAPLRTGAEMTGRTFNDVRETLNDAADAASDGIRRWWR